MRSLLVIIEVDNEGLNSDSSEATIVLDDDDDGGGGCGGGGGGGDTGSMSD